jgi:AraC-like DNA-binding protein
MEMSARSCEKSFLFSPSQPVIQFHTDEYKEWNPKTRDGGDVALYYQFKTDDHGQISIIPDGCVDLLFCCDPGAPFAVLALSPEQRTYYQFKENSEYFGVRFYPEQCSFRFQCAMKEILCQQQIPLFDVLDIDSSLMEEIGVQKGFRERVEVFNRYMKTIKTDVNYDQKLIKSCIEKIYSIKNGFLSIKQLSEETGYSDRYIRKKFEEYIGFSPKQFSQIIRFQQTVSEILFEAPNNIEEIIDNRGFYDESHFYKGFKKFARQTPKQFLSGVRQCK